MSVPCDGLLYVPASQLIVHSILTTAIRCMLCAARIEHCRPPRTIHAQCKYGSCSGYAVALPTIRADRSGYAVALPAIRADMVCPCCTVTCLWPLTCTFGIPQTRRLPPWAGPRSARDGLLFVRARQLIVHSILIAPIRGMLLRCPNRALQT